jgi:hypothetical protein
VTHYILQTIIIIIIQRNKAPRTNGKTSELRLWELMLMKLFVCLFKLFIDYSMSCKADKKL